jgi:hypothetical protein
MRCRVHRRTVEGDRARRLERFPSEASVSVRGLRPAVRVRPGAGLGCESPAGGAGRAQAEGHRLTLPPARLSRSAASCRSSDRRRCWPSLSRTTSSPSRPVARLGAAGASTATAPGLPARCGSRRSDMLERWASLRRPWASPPRRGLPRACATGLPVPGAGHRRRPGPVSLAPPGSRRTGLIPEVAQRSSRAAMTARTVSSSPPVMSSTTRPGSAMCCSSIGFMPPATARRRRAVRRRWRRHPYEGADCGSRPVRSAHLGKPPRPGGPPGAPRPAEELHRKGAGQLPSGVH